MGKNYLIGLTGSIACYKTCSLISQLVKTGHNVQVVATESALRFVGAATLEGLTGRPVATSLYESGSMMNHIDLARWADVFVVAPATASHIAQFAQGLASDLLSTLYLAYEQEKRFYIAPAMNTKMLEHAATESNLKILKERGAIVLEPNSGRLACGEEGSGKMMEPEQIFHILNEKKSKILITYGGTNEPIDGVRTISNSSSGRTGLKLIEKLAHKGYEVHALAGSTAPTTRLAHQSDRFTSHADLDSKLKNQLQALHFDAVIHLAAVSDFTVSKIQIDSETFEPNEHVKFSSATQEMTLHLKKTKKIVNSLKKYSHNQNITVIAFKLTKTQHIEERKELAEKLLNSGGINFVVQNDLYEIDHTTDAHPFYLYGPNQPAVRILNVDVLAQTLDDLLSAKPSRSHSINVFHSLEVNNDLMS